MGKTGVIGMVILALVLTIVAVLLPQAMYAADYAVDNGTASNSTDTTFMVGQVESAWFWGIAILVLVLAIGGVFWGFFVK